MYLSRQLSSSKAAVKRKKAEQGFRPRGLQGQTLDLGAQLGEGTRSLAGALRVIS